ncbi:triosephosphate isomerase [Candidatus Roizmanbacteria bacterium]|nr:triosephosphate isomerase [Candidatus Roizmanbacteria bacterium]
MRYFIANWKANKDLNEAFQWIDTFIKLQLNNGRVKVVICPPSPLLYPLKERIKNSNIELGAQDISQFEEGKYTGEITAKTLKGLVDYSIVGHSERRKYFNEDYDTLSKKVLLAKKYDIEPIFCIRGVEDKIPQEVNIVTYEPVYAIGTGDNESPEIVLKVKKSLKLDEGKFFLYGGSVDKNNVESYLTTLQIDGFLVGTASLDPEEFFAVVKKV